MASPLARSLARTIGKAMGGLFLPATLARDTAGAGDPWNQGAPVPTTYSCKAIFDEWSAYTRQGGLVGASDRKVLVLASTLAVVPQPGDRITIDGATLTVVTESAGQPAVSTDPAKAVWTLRCRS